MCGRFNLILSTEQFVEQFGLSNTPDLSPRYNIAPGQEILAIVAAGDTEHAAAYFRWGLVPSWADDARIGNRMINARAETVADKPAFRAAFRKRRCLIPATGFYEWHKQDGGKQPYHIHRNDNRPFCFAGLWEHWEKAGSVIQSCAILTTNANSMMARIHDRMPVIVPTDAYDLWLDHQTADRDRLSPVLQPHPSEFLVAEPISTHVNNPANDDPRCIKPIT